MSQSISNNGEVPLTSGNVLYWFREDIPGQRGGIRATFKSQPSHRDTKEAKQYMESLVPAGASVVAAAEVEGMQRTKALLDKFLGRGASN